MNLNKTFNYNNKILFLLNNLLFSFILLIIIVALFWRIRFSVEMTDEIHGIAGTINIIQGKRPFSTSWDFHTGWCLVH